MILLKVFKEKKFSTDVEVLGKREFLPHGTFLNLDIEAALRYKKLAEEQEELDNVFYGIELIEIEL